MPKEPEKGWRNLITIVEFSSFFPTGRGFRGLTSEISPSEAASQTISYQGVWVGEESKLDILTSEIRIGSLANCLQSSYSPPPPGRKEGRRRRRLFRRWARKEEIPGQKEVRCPLTRVCPSGGGCS